MITRNSEAALCISKHQNTDRGILDDIHDAEKLLDVSEIISVLDFWLGILSFKHQHFFSIQLLWVKIPVGEMVNRQHLRNFVT